MSKEMYIDFKGKTVLVSVLHWVMAPDGIEYKAVYGRLSDMDSDTVRIGEVIIPFREIYAMVQSDECNLNDAPSWTADPKHGITHYWAPTKIFDAR